MCGLVGFLGSAGPWAEGADALVTAMAACIRHRGPDHAQVWTDPAAGIALGHNRLAIVDLSPAGNQPMASAGGRFVLVYNGEIYNHLAIREELSAAGARFEWRGHSDTETLLAAIETWGLRQALVRSVGMFALALWDRERRELTLARDRAGEKPLYYGWQGEGAGAAFLFGSELKALRPHPAFGGDVDRDTLTLYLRYSCVPGGRSIYRGLAQVPPGALLTVSLDRREPVIELYWSFAEVAKAGAADPFAGTVEEAVDTLEALLREAVGGQLMADVPLGAFLSGGIDSSTVVALMQAQSTQPVRTFSIGFEEAGYNEADHAKAVAAHLGTAHTELYVSPREAQAVIPRLPAIYDEPFADASQIPTLLVSQLARRHVTVSLSGDGGDELFGGYPRHAMAQGWWRRASAVPAPLRVVAARGLTALSAQQWNRLAPGARRPGDKLHKLARLVASGTPGDFYRAFLSAWHEPAAVVIDGHEPPTLVTAAAPALAALNPAEQTMALDFLSYLPDDILTKVDRAAMAVSLETRVPLLDHRVIEFAWRLPMALKLRGGPSKWALRQVLYRHVPRTLVDRPKMGFNVPIDAWLRGPLRDWAEALLDERRLRQEGFFHPAPIRAAWQAHLSGHSDRQQPLWNVLMFQAWLEAQRETV